MDKNLYTHVILNGNAIVFQISGGCPFTVLFHQVCTSLVCLILAHYNVTELRTNKLTEIAYSINKKPRVLRTHTQLYLYAFYRFWRQIRHNASLVGANLLLVANLIFSQT